MFKLEVGRPHPALRPPVPEGGYFNWSADALELLLAFRRPGRGEVEGVRRGACEFALVSRPPALFLLYTFAGLPWSDAPYTPHLLPPDRRPDTAPMGTPEARLLLQVVLVDAVTARVEALRAVSLAPEFSRTLAQMVREQASAPWPGRAAYDQALADAYRQFPDTADMLPFAVARCHGGA